MEEHAVLQISPCSLQFYSQDTVLQPPAELGQREGLLTRADKMHVNFTVAANGAPFQP